MRSSFAMRLAALLMAAALLLPGAAVAETYPFSGYLTQDTVLRKSPSDTAASVRALFAGDAILVTGESGSYYIASYLGVQGYVPKKQVSTTKNGGTPVISPEEAAAAESSVYALLYSGMSGDQVAALQDALIELGFLNGTADGKFGPATQKAVKAFQQKNGLTQTGTADGKMQELIFGGKPKNSAGKAVTVKTVPPLASAVISSGSIGSQVKKLQDRLKELDYYTGAVDGVCGSGTVSAIKAFQKKMGLSQTGKADAALRALLYGSTALSAKATNTPRPTATPKATATPTPSGQTAVYPYKTTTNDSVNLRKSASTSSTRLGTVSKGAQIEVLSSDGAFLRVNALGKTGYVMAEYVNIPVQYLPGTVLAGDADAQQKYTLLQYGASGDKVKALQDALQELGFLLSPADGIFGVNTVNALKNFQNKNGLREDSIASAEIQKLIYEGKPKNSKGVKTDVKTLPPIADVEMRLNDRGDAVAALQNDLRLLGYYTGSASGIFDAATDKAVRSFQKAHSLTVDGVVGKKTGALLSALADSQASKQTTTAPQPTAPAEGITAANVVVMYEGTKGVAVTDLQQRLKDLGYLTDQPDGVVGKNTIAAVKRFQQRNGLAADGIAGLDTQKKLYSMGAVPAVTSAPTNSPLPFAAQPNLKITLKVGSSGEEVRMLQERLTVLKYYNTAVDSIYGSGTAQSVTLFQKSNGLTADGVAGPNTLQKLYSASALAYTQPQPLPASPVSETPVTASVLQSGDSGTQVKNMQLRLVALGYLTVADGIFGPKTYQAVKTFQQRNGLTADGIAGKMTLTRLNSAAAVAAFGTSAATYDQPTTGTTGTTGSFKAPSASKVKVADWYNVIRDQVRKMPDVVIYDPISGLHYNLHMFSFGKHADAEPPTAADTAIMNRVVGENSWTPKFVWVILSDGTVYLGSTHSHGHEVDHTSGNDLTGHICVHFPRSMSDAEATGPYAVSHQKEINYGKEMLNAMLGK